MRFATIPLLALAALCVSCSQSSAPPPAAAKADPPAQKTVIDDQLKALDKAKAVQDTLDQQAKERDKKMQEQGG